MSQTATAPSVTDRPPRATLIGLGLLGSALSARLEGLGYSLLGWDCDPEARQRWVAAQPTRQIARPVELTRESSLLWLCLPSGSEVRHALPAYLPGMAPGSWIVDSTTVGPDEARDFAAQVQQVGGHYLEARVAGSSEEVRRGEALIFVAAESVVAEAFRRAMSAGLGQLHVLGEVPAATHMKLVFNHVLGLHRAVLAEGLSLAEHQGLDAARVLEILRAGSAASEVMRTKGPKMVAADYQPQARLAQHTKDVRLILQWAREAGLGLPLEQTHLALLEQAERLGFGAQDNASVIEVYRRGLPDDSG